MTAPMAGAEQSQSEIVPLQLIGPDTDAGLCADGSCLLPDDSVPDVAPAHGREGSDG